jgi:hypothetical protein
MLPPFWAVEAGFDEIGQIQHPYSFVGAGSFAAGRTAASASSARSCSGLIKPTRRRGMSVRRIQADVFHLALACQSPVFVERALTHRKMNLAFEIEVPAKNFFLGGAKSLDDMPVAAGPAQRFGALRCSSFHFDGDHNFLFSKKRHALRFVPAASKHTTSVAARQ